MDGVHEPDENGKISNLLDPDAEKQTSGQKSQNWTNLRDENGILLYFYAKKKTWNKKNVHLLVMLQNRKLIDEEKITCL
ncbi:hypothetical protein Hanom_Chr14g01307861 [Helianthus anomalus]